MDKIILPKNLKSDSTIAIILLALVSFIAFYRVLDNKFVYDDEFQILLENFITSEHAFSDIISLNVLKMDVLDRNRPGSLLSLWVDYKLWGSTPVGFHLTSIILHILVVLLLFFLLKRILNQAHLNTTNSLQILAPFTGALWFALHPVNFEVVAMATYREDSIVLLAILCMIWLFDKMLCDQQHNHKLIWGLASCALVAAITKENGYIIGLYAVMYALFFYGYNVFRRKDVLLAIGTLVIVPLLFVILTVFVVPDETAIVMDRPKILGGADVITMLKIQLSIWGFQFFKWIYPANLSLEYTTYAMRFFPWKMVLTALVIILPTLFWLFRRNKIVVFGLLYTILALVPTSNFVPQFRAVADRFLYIPGVGIALIISYLFSLGLKNKETIKGKVLISLLCLHLVIITILLVGYSNAFESPRKLWRQVLKVSPNNSTAYSAMSTLAQENGDYRRAIDLQLQAIAIMNAKDAADLLRLAFLFKKIGETEPALQTLEKAIEVNNKINNLEYVEMTKRFSKQEMEIIGQLFEMR